MTKFVLVISFIILTIFSTKIIMTITKPKPNQTSLSLHTIPIITSKKWGAYTGSTEIDYAYFKSKIPYHMDYLATFVHWGNESQFPETFASLALNEKSTLVIFWEAMDYTHPSPSDARFSYDSILEGRWDTYINSFAKSASKYPGQIILIPFEEANGDWNPWSGTINGNSPAFHIAAYRYIRSKFNSIPNVKFGWAVNNLSSPDTPNNQLSYYFPGEAYVDYVGVNGFNFGDPWQSNNTLFDGALNQLSTYKKPLIIFSFASAPGDEKASWINQTLSRFNQDSRISGWIWFNENKEKDWRIWSDQKSLQAFISNLPQGTN